MSGQTGIVQDDYLYRDREAAAVIEGHAVWLDDLEDEADVTRSEEEIVAEGESVVKTKKNKLRTSRLTMQYGGYSQ